MVEFVGVWALVRRFGNIRGWELPEVAILCWLVIDRLLDRRDRGRRLRPVLASDRAGVRPPAAAAAPHRDAGGGGRVRLARLGRWLQAVVILIWGLASAEIPRSPLRVLLLAETMAGATLLFLGVFVATAAIAF